MKDKNIIAEKSLAFAVRIVKLYKYLSEEKHEYVLSKQILKSGTSIGANIREAMEGFSKKEFTAKMGISLKEAAESEYWLELLYQTEYLTQEEYSSMVKDCRELIRILTTIIKTARDVK